MTNKLAQTYFDKVLKFFNGDTTKTWTWFKSPNPSLGMVSPLDMVRTGRTIKLGKHIESAFQGERHL